jgi:nitroreductase/uncharacterized protein YciI
MPLFAIIARDRLAALEQRMRVRPAHLASLQPLVEQGRVRFAGPTLAPDGTPNGSILLLELDSLEQARACAAADPYVQQGVFAHYQVYETRQTLGMPGVLEALETCRAIRYLRPDPVPDALVERVLRAATQASNPGNSQAWAFVVVRDRERRRRLREAIEAAMRPTLDAMRAAPLDRKQRRLLDGAAHLAQHLDRAPVIIAVCARNLYPPHAPQEMFVWSAVYPASQNLIVAARALGLGTTFTTLHTVAEKAVREVLELPDDVYLGTLIPMGWPDRPFGPVARRPLSEVVHRDRWQAAPAARSEP